MGAIAVAIAQASISFVDLTWDLSQSSPVLLHRIGVNVHAEGAHGDGIRKSAERLLLDLNLGLLIYLNRRIDFVRGHAPQLTRIRELCADNRELDALFRVRRIQYRDGQRLAIFAECGDDIERIRRAAR